MRFKVSIIALVFCFTASTGRSQAGYSDSLKSYQQKYKDDLYPVITTDTGFVKFYPIDQSYRVIAKVERLQGQDFFPMATSGNISKEAIKYAVIKFTLAGKDYAVAGYRLSQLMKSNQYKDDFFIPFTDATSGKESYAGGKYIDLLTTDISAVNTIIIDFNKSYNPYCAFRSGFNCPIPPKENDLPVEIRAGEMGFQKKKDPSQH